MCTALLGGGQFIEKLIFEEYAALQRRHLVIYSSRMPIVAKDPRATLCSQ